MKIQEHMITQGHPNRCGEKIVEPRALIIHYTQNDHPDMGDEKTAIYFARRWERGQIWINH